MSRDSGAILPAATLSVADIGASLTRPLRLPGSGMPSQLNRIRPRGTFGLTRVAGSAISDRSEGMRQAAAIPTVRACVRFRRSFP